MSEAKTDPTDETVFWTSCNRVMGIADLMSEIDVNQPLAEKTLSGLGKGIYEDMKIIKEMYQGLLSAYMKKPD